MSYDECQPLIIFSSPPFYSIVPASFKFANLPSPNHSCAWAYGNEAEVGQGIKASGVPREELWITSKLFELHHHPEHVELAVKDTLKNLGLEYLDLYLMHWNVGPGTRATAFRILNSHLARST